MADKKKKMAAALSAVSAYLQQEEAAALQAQAAEQTSAPCEYGPSQWSHSGRQEMMSMRRLIQLRAFDRFR